MLVRGVMVLMGVINGRIIGKNKDIKHYRHIIER